MAMDRLRRGLAGAGYHAAWVLCGVFESVAAYSHWYPEVRLMAGLLSGQYAGLVRFCAAFATLSAPVLMCILLLRSFVKS